MIRLMSIASLVATALMTTACDIPKNEEQPTREPQYGKPPAPGSSFTDLPPLEPPEPEPSKPEPQP